MRNRRTSKLTLISLAKELLVGKTNLSKTEIGKLFMRAFFRERAARTTSRGEILLIKGSIDLGYKSSETYEFRVAQVD